jgi:hypothetical protein
VRLYLYLYTGKRGSSRLCAECFDQVKEEGRSLVRVGEAARAGGATDAEASMTVAGAAGLVGLRARPSSSKPSHTCSASQTRITIMIGLGVAGLCTAPHPGRNATVAVLDLNMTCSQLL